MEWTGRVVPATESYDTDSRTEQRLEVEASPLLGGVGCRESGMASGKPGNGRRCRRRKPVYRDSDIAGHHPACTRAANGKGATTLVTGHGRT